LTAVIIFILFYTKFSTVMDFYISQGSVATFLRLMGMLYEILSEM